MESAGLAALSAAVVYLSQEYGKGLAGEAGKAAWTQIKSLFGWREDPSSEEIPEKIKRGLELSPRVQEDLLLLLQRYSQQSHQPLVGVIKVSDSGKLVVASTIENLTM